MDGAEADICVSCGAERGGGGGKYRGAVSEGFYEIVRCSNPPPHPPPSLCVVGAMIRDNEIQQVSAHMSPIDSKFFIFPFFFFLIG